MGAFSKQQNDLCSFPRQTIQYHSNPSLSPTSNAEEAAVERFNEDLPDFIEHPNNMSIPWDWNEKVESQEIPGVTGKFGLGVQNESGQRLTKFC